MEIVHYFFVDAEVTYFKFYTVLFRIKFHTKNKTRFSKFYKLEELINNNRKENHNEVESYFFEGLKTSIELRVKGYFTELYPSDNIKNVKVFLRNVSKVN